jgi:hypothetical protein
MPDDVTSVSRYEQDFYAWAFEQAEALRAVAEKNGLGREGSAADLDAIDWANLAEEIEGLAQRDRRELASRIATIVEHLVKLEHSPAREPRGGWMETVARSRREIRRLLEDSPSLRREAPGLVERETGDALRDATCILAEYGERSAKALGYLGLIKYTPDQVLEDWWPETTTKTPSPTRRPRRQKARNPA